MRKHDSDGASPRLCGMRLVPGHRTTFRMVSFVWPRCGGGPPQQEWDREERALDEEVADAPAQGDVGGAGGRGGETDARWNSCGLFHCRRRVDGRLESRCYPFSLLYAVVAVLLLSGAALAYGVHSRSALKLKHAAADGLLKDSWSLAVGAVGVVNARVAQLKAVSRIAATLPAKQWSASTLTPLLPALDITADLNGAEFVAYASLVIGSDERADFEGAMSDMYGRQVNISAASTAARSDSDDGSWEVAPDSGDTEWRAVALARPPLTNQGPGLVGLDLCSLSANMLDADETPTTAIDTALQHGASVSGPLRFPGSPELLVSVESPVFALSEEDRLLAEDPDPASFSPTRYHDPQGTIPRTSRLTGSVAAVFSVRNMLINAFNSAILPTFGAYGNLPSQGSATNASSLTRRGLSVVVEDVTGLDFSAQGTPIVGLEDFEGPHRPPKGGKPKRPGGPGRGPGHPRALDSVAARSGMLHGCGSGVPLLVLSDDQAPPLSGADEDAVGTATTAVLGSMADSLKQHAVDDQLRSEVSASLTACQRMSTDTPQLHVAFKVAIAERVWAFHVHGDSRYLADTIGPVAKVATVATIAVGAAGMAVCISIVAALKWLEATGRRDYERQQGKASRSAHRSLESVMSFACHELRNPLHAIRACHDALTLAIPTSSPERPDVDAVGIAVSACQQVVDDILDLAALRSGKLQVNPTLVDVRNMLKQLALQNRSFAAVPIVVVVSEALPERVFADELRLRQLLSNGITNAAKHCNHGCITVRAWLETAGLSAQPESAGKSARRGHQVAPVPATSHEDRATLNRLVRAPPTKSSTAYLCLEVIDTGAGLGGTDPSVLFEAFSQNHSAKPDTPEPQRGSQSSPHPRDVRSTGLGLPICKLLATAMDGEVGLRDRAVMVDAGRRTGRSRGALVLRPPSDLRNLPAESTRSVFFPGSAGAALSIGGEDGSSTGAIFAIRVPVNEGAAGAAGGAPRVASAQHLLPRHRSSLLSRDNSSRSEIASAARVASPQGAIHSPKASRMLRGESGTHDVELEYAEEPTRTSLSPPGSVVEDPGVMQPTPGPLHGMHFIAVDDESLNRRVMARMLRALGATVATLADGDEVLAHLRVHHADVLHRHTSPSRLPSIVPVAKSTLDGILLDNYMSRQNGLETCMQLRTVGVLIPIILTSASVTDADDRARFIAAGFSDVLRKPFDRHVLAEALRPKAQGAADSAAAAHPKHRCVSESSVVTLPS